MGRSKRVVVPAAVGLLVFSGLAGMPSATASDVSVEDLIPEGAAIVEGSGDPQTGDEVIVATLDSSDGDVTPMDASGCTLAPGTAGTLACISVYGSGTYVWETEPGFISPGNNICNTTAHTRYTKAGQSVYSNRYGTAPGCVVANRYVTVPILDYAKNNSTVCGRTKNSVNGQVYTPYACVNVFE